MGEIADEHQSYIADEIMELEMRGELEESMSEFWAHQRAERQRQAERNRAPRRMVRPDDPPPF